MKNICCYGGAFDPVHKGHLYFAEAIIGKLHPDKFFFIPAARSPFKNDEGHATALQRLKMLELAIGTLPGCAVLDLEIKRGGSSYTIDTLKTLKKEYPAARLYWIIGDDHLDSLEKWRNWPEHFSYSDFLVLPRTLTLPQIKMQIQRLRHAGQIQILEAEPYPLSSTLVREKIRRGDAYANDIPPAVSQYIREQRLYGILP